MATRRDRFAELILVKGGPMADLLQCLASMSQRQRSRRIFKYRERPLLSEYR